MKKKNFIAAIFAAAAVLLAGSCDKNAWSGEEPAPGDGEVWLKVNLGNPSTKVAAQSATSEQTIRNVQIFVFRAGSGGDAGNLEVAASAGFDQELNVTGGTFNEIKVKCSTGEREIWAVVNDSADRTAGADAVATKSDFLALTHELKDARKDKLLMIGTAGVQTLREGEMEIPMQVHRLAASVVLESVTNDFYAPAYRKANTFRVEDCYLINVPASVNFGETLVPADLPESQWYARRAAETASPKGDLIYDKVTTPKVVNYGDSDQTVHTFYAYPNDCAVNEDATWCPRATLLVLEASVNNGHEWVKYYYPVAIESGLESNKQYKVKLTIRRPGSLDPNTPVKLGDVQPVITVLPWMDGTGYDQEI